MIGAILTGCFEKEIEYVNNEMDVQEDNKEIYSIMEFEDNYTSILNDTEINEEILVHGNVTKLSTTDTSFYLNNISFTYPYIGDRLLCVGENVMVVLRVIVTNEYKRYFCVGIIWDADAKYVDVL